jgi:D-sedoheptulose 7-phosphate isomerase
MKDLRLDSGSSLGLLDGLIRRYPQLDPCQADIERAFQIMRDAYLAGKKILVCGNGGSAADADHWAGELLKSFSKPRPLAREDKDELPPELADHLQEGLPMIPLTGFSALNTAFANDVAAEFTFAQLVWSLGKAGDVFVGISTSGNARNVCAAAQAARVRRMPTVALTGESGGRLRSLSDITIAAPARETYIVQELHLPIYHCLCLMLEEEFFATKPESNLASVQAVQEP